MRTKLSKRRCAVRRTVLPRKWQYESAILFASQSAGPAEVNAHATSSASLDCEGCNKKRQSVANLSSGGSHRFIPLISRRRSSVDGGLGLTLAMRWIFICKMLSNFHICGAMLCLAYCKAGDLSFLPYVLARHPLATQVGIANQHELTGITSCR